MRMAVRAEVKCKNKNKTRKLDGVLLLSPVYSFFPSNCFFCSPKVEMRFHFLTMEIDQL